MEAMLPVNVLSSLKRMKLTISVMVVSPLFVLTMVTTGGRKTGGLHP